MAEDAPEVVLPDDLYKALEEVSEEREVFIKNTNDYFDKTTAKHETQEQFIKNRLYINTVLKSNETKVYGEIGQAFMRGGIPVLESIYAGMVFAKRMSQTGSVIAKTLKFGLSLATAPIRLAIRLPIVGQLIKTIAIFSGIYLAAKTVWYMLPDACREYVVNNIQKAKEFSTKYAEKIVLWLSGQVDAVKNSDMFKEVFYDGEQKLITMTEVFKRLYNKVKGFAVAKGTMLVDEFKKMLEICLNSVLTGNHEREESEAERKYNEILNSNDFHDMRNKIGNAAYNAGATYHDMEVQANAKATFMELTKAETLSHLTFGLIDSDNEDFFQQLNAFSENGNISLSRKSNSEIVLNGKTITYNNAEELVNELNTTRKAVFEGIMKSNGGKVAEALFSGYRKGHNNIMVNGEVDEDKVLSLVMETLKEGNVHNPLYKALTEKTGKANALVDESKARQTSDFIRSLINLTNAQRKTEEQVLTEKMQKQKKNDEYYLALVPYKELRQFNMAKLNALTAEKKVSYERFLAIHSIAAKFEKFMAGQYSNGTNSFWVDFFGMLKIAIVNHLGIKYDNALGDSKHFVVYDEEKKVAATNYYIDEGTAAMITVRIDTEQDVRGVIANCIKCVLEYNKNMLAKVIETNDELRYSISLLQARMEYVRAANSNAGGNGAAVQSHGLMIQPIYNHFKNAVQEQVNTTAVELAALVNIYSSQNRI